MQTAAYSCQVTAISRSAGRSAPAAAAYRHGAALTDERTGQKFDFRRRTGLETQGLEGATNLAALWRTAEAAETRRNSVVAREVRFSLPHEISEDERRRISREVAADLRARFGVAASWANHLPSKDGDNRNFHCHLLITTRRVSTDGVFGPKTRELDVHRSGAIDEIREMVERRGNDALARAGLPRSLDRRSLAAQAASCGVRPPPPTIHLGPTATALERRGIRTGRGDWNRKVRQLRADRIVPSRPASIDQIRTAPEPLGHSGMDAQAAREAQPATPRAASGLARALAPRQAPLGPSAMDILVPNIGLPPFSPLPDPAPQDDQAAQNALAATRAASRLARALAPRQESPRGPHDPTLATLRTRVAFRLAARGRWQSLATRPEPPNLQPASADRRRTTRASMILLARSRLLTLQRSSPQSLVGRIAAATKRLIQPTTHNPFDDLALLPRVIARLRITEAVEPRPGPPGFESGADPWVHAHVTRLRRRAEERARATTKARKEEAARQAQLAARWQAMPPPPQPDTPTQPLPTSPPAPAPPPPPRRRRDSGWDR